ncbi:conserved hypothetical protein [Trichinella spiralis]|uniref:hypothetical protein n=1 Tax=Trichinella spiralis TaxID=6334 RepID=UPI0001EFED0C|nr:conserved hypothetical protein [Trichinella spiralis]
MLSATLASVGSTFPHSIAKAVVKILLCGKEINCLIDSGSSESFIHPEVVKRLGLKIIPSSEPISITSSALSIKALGCITVDLKVQDRLYKSFRLRVLPHLCADVILGQDFHRMHESVMLNYGGNLPPLIICGLATLRVHPPRLFAHLTPDCPPIASTSRKFSAEDTNFIRNEVRALLEDGDERRKKRLVVDYSATIFCVWKTIQLALKSQGLPTEQWPAVLPDALHALFLDDLPLVDQYPCDFWTKHVRDSKTDLLVEVRLLEVNPTYAYVRFPDGRESSVSTRHLAPTGSGDAEEAQQEVTAGDDCSENCEPLHQENEEKTTLRRSQRIRRPPQRLDLDVSLEGGECCNYSV